MMSEEERDRLVNAAIEARVTGDKKAAEEFLRQIPVDPETARSIKDAGGPGALDYMIARGYNFSEEVAKYGTEWLTS